MSFRFEKHEDLRGLHAFLSASTNHWLNYDREKMRRVYTNKMAATRGTDLHNLAAEMIRLGVKLPKTPQTLNMYVNDAIGLRMKPEVVLFATPNAFGTADAIWFGPNFHNPTRNILRVHDLKTGEGPVKVTQLEVYAAYFCLEYDIEPIDIDLEFRIYQNDERLIYEGDPAEIKTIMNKTIAADRIINELRMEALL